MGSTSDKFMGKGKKMTGKMTNDKSMEAKGKVQEEKGKVKGYFE
jgi:uncharacterized protein YjbJ (UPF0337 family)